MGDGADQKQSHEEIGLRFKDYLSQQLLLDQQQYSVVCCWCGTTHVFNSMEERAEKSWDTIANHMLECEKRPELQLVNKLLEAKALIERLIGDETVSRNWQNDAVKFLKSCESKT